jgi:hypothetical protein
MLQIPHSMGASVQPLVLATPDPLRAFDPFVISFPASGGDEMRRHIPKCAPMTAAASSFALSPWLRNRVSEKKPWMVPG